VGWIMAFVYDEMITGFFAAEVCSRNDATAITEGKKVNPQGLK
jgi:hypothetical protein